MPRKITTGKVGGPILGEMSVTDSTFSSVKEGENIILAPTVDGSGNGFVDVTSDLIVNNGKTLRLNELSANGSNFVGLSAPASLTSNFTYTLPNSFPDTSGKVLVSDTSGSMSWIATSLTVANRSAADPGPYYLAMCDQTTGSEDTLSISSASLSFVPQTGTLSTTNISVTGITATGTSVITTADINGGNIDGTVIGNATPAAGTFTTLSATSITETSSIVYKENVNPIANALESILDLVGVTYDRKDGTSKNEAGLIAEETAKVLPNIVTFKDGSPEGINYTKLSAYLIESVKSLKSEIEDLKKEIK